MTTHTTSPLYVLLPDDEHGRPAVYTAITAGAPLAATGDITLQAASTIDTAHRAEPDTTTCHRCGTPVGYHFVASTDPEQFRNTGFYVTTDGTILCEECA